MKKSLFAVLAMAAFMTFGGVAMAGPPHHGGGMAIGVVDVEATAVGGGIDYDFQTIPNGVAGGISAAGGAANSEAFGVVNKGDVEATVGATGGGIVDTNAYRFNPNIGDRSIGVGSSSTAFGTAEADFKIKVDPASGRHAGGFVGAEMRGVAGEFTADASMVTESPRYFDSTGVAGGIAAQGAMGSFSGDGYAVSGPDMRGRCFSIDSKAGAGAGASIELTGGSYSESYRAVDWNNGATTEIMGNNVGAFTTVDSHGYDYDWDKGISHADADVNSRGFVAAGGAVSHTTQSLNGGTTTATAVGAYAGSGRLGGSYAGSANGGTYSQATRVAGTQGSIMSSSATMSVSSVSGGNTPR